MLENKEIVTTPAPLDPDVDDAGELVPVRVPLEPVLTFPPEEGVGVEAVEVGSPEGVNLNKSELWKVWQLELAGMRGV